MSQTTKYHFAALYADAGLDPWTQCARNDDRRHENLARVGNIPRIAASLLFVRLLRRCFEIILQAGWIV